MLLDYKKMEPSSWRSRGLGPPLYFKKVTYLYGFEEDAEEQDKDKKKKKKKDKK